MRGRVRWSLRWQVGAAVSLTALAVALLVTATAFLLERHLDRDRFLNSSASAVAADANQLATVARTGGRQAVLAAAQDVGRQGLVRVFAIYQGRRSLTPGECGPGTCQGLPTDIAAGIDRRRRAQTWIATGGGSALIVSEPITDTGLTVVVTFDYSLQQTQLTDLRNDLLAVAAVAVVLGTAVGWQTSRGISRPVRQASTVARSMGGGDLTVRMPERGSTETAELAAEFNRMAHRLSSTIDELRVTTDRQRRFVADVSHELRTPLASISAAADALRIDDAHSRVHAVTLLQSQTARLADMVGDLLDLSLADAGDIRLDREPIDIAAVARDAATMVAGGREVTISTQGDPRMDVDVRRIHTALRNLIANAVNHGADPISVVIDGRGDPVVVTVTDHGRGVPTALRATLFDRFVRGDSSRAGNGDSTGLGLALVRQNIELHAGTVTLREAGPTTFVITLPRHAPSAGMTDDGTGHRPP